MVRLGNPRATVTAYAAAVGISALMIGGGAGLATYFRTHQGTPPPIIVVAEAPPAPPTTIVPTTRSATTTVKVVVPPEQIPPQLPDAAAYTGAPVTGRPDFVNVMANDYGWFGGDGASARCDEWHRATVIGSTAQTLFVVCGSYFKAYDLVSGTPLRTGVAGGGGRWSGAGAGLAIQLTESALTIVRDGGDPAVQAVVEWWTP
ncbi:hypothetical protein [Nocardia huaxiensis]|uniref:Uncharacterized protein n=1 Tax=Nocardia huaxiensis TaxID=2755382 RepID=A0A7D6ZB80_9NOCA|nr:hypothetical protein [Nocardia huaxiensis]QLY29518.1 hypothetical protein H0264_30345 [Nocardia huaxiensis]UFS96924.1 hypothetical protein LPY97_03040 [Nocardia huaxiensis]